MKSNDLTKKGRADDLCVSMELSEGLVAAVGGGGVTALFGWLSARATAKGKAPADLTEALAHFQTALGVQTETFIRTLQADRQALQAERQALQDEIAGLRRRIEELENENLQCRGETAQMRQHIESLEEYLRRKGMDIPKGRRPQGLTVLEDGKATHFSLETTPKPRRTRKATS